MNDSLLTDPVITVRNAAETRRLSLPGVLAALGRDAVESFPALRPHQRHAWHAFLCQLAVLALERAGQADATEPGDEAVWRDLLRGLTQKFPEDEPWRLVVTDLAKPAFLQPPVPEGTCNRWMMDKSPFDIDVLTLSKQHGEKNKQSLSSAPENYLYSLVSKQTQAEYTAAGSKARYYQTVRQAGVPFNKFKVASRPCVCLSVSPRPGPNWERDCRVLLANLDALRRNVAGYPEKGGQGLLWLEPWAGGKDDALPLAKLHPLFIEVCRRIRLVLAEDGGVTYRTTGTKGPRVAAKDCNGAVGDPWLPLRRDKGGVKAFNSRPGYDEAWKVFFSGETYVPSLLQRFHPGDPEEGVSAVFRVFLRTQGGSDGYHERVVPIQKQHLNYFRKHKDTAAEMAEQMADLARKARNGILKPALLQLMQAAKDSPEYKQKETNDWAWKQSERLAEKVDADFFLFLWRCLDARGEDAFDAAQLMPWARFLAVETRAVLQAAAEAMPIQGALRYRGRAMAENLLEKNIIKHLRTRSDNG